MERARDLFEQALDGCPAEYAQSNFNVTKWSHFYVHNIYTSVIWGIRVTSLSLSLPPSLPPSLPFSLSPHLDLYLLYAKLEEDYGLTRRAMSVYERATEAVLPEEQYDVCHVTITLLSCDYHVILFLIDVLYIHKACV